MIRGEKMGTPKPPIVIAWMMEISRFRTSSDSTETVIMAQLLTTVEPATGEPGCLPPLLTRWVPTPSQSRQGRRNTPSGPETVSALKKHFILKGGIVLRLSNWLICPKCSKPPIFLKDCPSTESMFKQPDQWRAKPNTSSVSAVCGVTSKCALREHE